MEVKTKSACPVIATMFPVPTVGMLQITSVYCSCDMDWSFRLEMKIIITNRRSWKFGFSSGYPVTKHSITSLLYYCHNNECSNNNDRLTAFDPGQPG